MKYCIVPGRRAGVRHVFLLASLTLFLPACAGDDHGSADGFDALERSRTRGLRVGFSIEPPYAFVDSSGEATGEAPEIVRHVANELRIETVQWFPFPFHHLIPALIGGRIDVIASGMFLTPERRNQVRFSRPTACVQPVLVTRRGQELSPSSRSGGDRCEGCRIAVLEGGVEQMAFERHGRPGIDLVVAPDVSTATAALAQGRADVFAISAPTAREIVQRDSGLALLPAWGLDPRVADHARGCAAFAFRPEDAELTAAFDSVLAEFLGSPGHLRTVRPFGFTRAEVSCTEGVGRVPRARPGDCTPVEGGP